MPKNLHCTNHHTSWKLLQVLRKRALKLEFPLSISENLENFLIQLDWLGTQKHPTKQHAQNPKHVPLFSMTVSITQFGLFSACLKVNQCIRLPSVYVLTFRYTKKELPKSISTAFCGMGLQGESWEIRYSCNAKIFRLHTESQNWHHTMEMSLFWYPHSEENLMIFQTVSPQ
jgi:hypothetical protein